MLLVGLSRHQTIRIKLKKANLFHYYQFENYAIRLSSFHTDFSMLRSRYVGRCFAKLASQFRCTEQNVHCSKQGDLPWTSILFTVTLCYRNQNLELTLVSAPGKVGPISIELLTFGQG